jgi:hypothetical protein
MPRGKETDNILPRHGSTLHNWCTLDQGFHAHRASETGALTSLLGLSQSPHNPFQDSRDQTGDVRKNTYQGGCL